MTTNPRFPVTRSSFSPIRAMEASAAKRTGKRRYPSEKKKLKKIKETLTETDISQEEGFWRLSKLSVPVSRDPGKDFLGVSPPLLSKPSPRSSSSRERSYSAIWSRVRVRETASPFVEVPAMLPEEAFSIVRKSFDARKVLKELAFVYTVDVDVKKLLNLEPRTWDFIFRLEPKLGLVEYMPNEKVSMDLIGIVQKSKHKQPSLQLEKDGHGISTNSYNFSRPKNPKVAVVGSGPSGLFTSLVLGELGAEVTLIERGQAVEQRGCDIGALVVRRMLKSDSNFCFGEGGAGTWSDGKLVTRIGRNADSVQSVLKTLVHFGAPENILIDGKPHLGTDRLIPLIRNFRQHLKELGVNIKFGTRLNDLIVGDRQVLGLKVSDVTDGFDNQNLICDAVVLAVGHSARDVYRMLHRHDVDLVPKDFSVGLRIEHPQELINIQYFALADEVRNGRGKVPVADYKAVKYVDGGNNRQSPISADLIRSCYSFCMCPGGQVVLTSTDPEELCINGMSFSRRASRWANAALVTTISSNDFDPFRCHGPLAGVEFQVISISLLNFVNHREFERRAAMMGGGNFVVPVQIVTDFLDNKLSDTSLPPSSYRLGVKTSPLHELFPAHITQALQQSILMFDKELPGFISKDALLHGVETRTSAPVQIRRHADTFESTSLKGLYPVGEGAGYAGGIVSAAVDGMYCAFALAKSLDLYKGDIESVLGKVQKNTGFVKY